MPQASIRLLRDGDLDDIVDLGVRAWAPVFAALREHLGQRIYDLMYPDWQTMQAEEIRTTCIAHRDLTIVAERDGRAVGFATVVIRDAGTLTPKSGVVEMIAVDPDAQRNGIGRALLDSSLGMIRDAGCQVAIIGTGGDEGHAAARALYESAGLTPVPGVHYFLDTESIAPAS